MVKLSKKKIGGGKWWGKLKSKLKKTKTSYNVKPVVNTHTKEVSAANIAFGKRTPEEHMRRITAAVEFPKAGKPSPYLEKHTTKFTTSKIFN